MEIKCTSCGADNCINNGTCIKCNAALVTIDEQLERDLQIYGNSFEAMIDGKRVRIHPNDIRIKSLGSGKVVIQD